MQKKNQQFGFWLRGTASAGIIAIALISAGCANLPSGGEHSAAQTPEQQVAARSDARAKAIMAGDYKAEYGFMTPAYRQVASEDRYQVSHPNLFTLYAAKVDSVQCPSADTCLVKTAWTYKTKMGGRNIDVGKITNVIPEQWIKVDGQWWFYTKE